MITYTREELMKMFDVCGDIARYHNKVGKEAALLGETDKAVHHLNAADHYIAVRWDLLKLIKDGV